MPSYCTRSGHYTSIKFLSQSKIDNHEHAMERFTDNTKAARELKEIFEKGELAGTERPVELRSRNAEFMKYSVKSFSVKFRKFPARYIDGTKHYQSVLLTYVVAAQIHCGSSVMRVRSSQCLLTRSMCLQNSSLIL